MVENVSYAFLTLAGYTQTAPHVNSINKQQKLKNHSFENDCEKIRV